MTVLVARLSRSRSDVLRALRALEADGRITITIARKVQDCTTRERVYQAVAGATLDGLEPRPAPTRDGAQLKQQTSIENILIRGPATCQQVAIGARVSVQHARRVLGLLVEQGRVTRVQGPPPKTGSVRPYVYSWVKQ